MPHGETGANDPETQPSPEDIQNTINKTKKNKGFKKVIVAAAAVAMAGIIAAGAWLGINAFNKNNKSNNNPDRPGVTDVADVGSAVGESHETEGIYDGYGEKGMWLSENKGGSYDFASAKEVAEVCDNDGSSRKALKASQYWKPRKNSKAYQTKSSKRSNKFSIAP